MWLNSFNGNIEGEYRFTNYRWPAQKCNSLFRLKDNKLEFCHPDLKYDNVWTVWDSSNAFSNQEKVSLKINEFIASLDSILLGTSE